MNSLKSVIHILESPKPEEMLSGTHEGSALQKTLKVAGIEAQLHTVVNADMLKKCIEGITSDFKNSSSSSYNFPVIHFSAHGNEDAIGLTDGTSLTWQEFGTIMAPLNSALGGSLLLFMSTCQGFSGFKMAHTLGDPPFAFLVGPTSKISWPEALLAFHTVYHHFFYRDLDIDDALKAMNAALAVDPPVFRVAHGDDVNAAFKDIFQKLVDSLGLTKIMPLAGASS